MAATKSKPKKAKPARRLFVIFARDASEAVIFCRGPAAWFQVIRWDTKKDKFYPGAWIKGRIYPERCDLSPDGELLLYFVFHGKAGRTSYTYAYTGLSRSPWLSALGLWPQGSTWFGGGRFAGNRHIVINRQHATNRWSPLDVHPNHPAHGVQVDFGPAPNHKSSDEVEDAEWSGRDQRQRLVFVNKGKLYYRNKKGDDMELADFSEAEPDPAPAPDWAQKPVAYGYKPPKPARSKPAKRPARKAR